MRQLPDGLVEGLYCAGTQIAGLCPGHKVRDLICKKFSASGLTAVLERRRGREAVDDKQVCGRETRAVSFVDQVRQLAPIDRRQDGQELEGRPAA